MSDSVLWPFAPAQQVAEVLEWSTDVLQAESAEQRIGLRPVPRETLTLTHRLDALGMAQAGYLARLGYVGDWLVPLWHQARQPTAALTQGATEIPIDTTCSDFRAGDRVAIAADGGAAAVATISAVADDSLTLSAALALQLPAVITARGRLLVAPVRAAILSAEVSVSRKRQSDGVATAGFLLRDAPALDAPDQTLYLGRPVLTDPTILRGDLASSMSRTVEYVDNGFGPVVVEPVNTWFVRSETLTRKAQGPVARWALRRWLYALEGRRLSFWLPTWGRDLQLRAAVTATATSLTVAPLGPVAGYVGRKIVAETSAGLAFATITAAVESGLDHVLTLGAAFGTALPVGAPIHFMSAVRADADRFEIAHGLVASEVNIPFIEVPE